jgi:hypothetical protein
MLAYNYSFETKEYTGVCDIYESPLEPGVWLYPANSTDVVPPDFNAATQVCEYNEELKVWNVRARTETPLPPLPTQEELDAALSLDMRNARNAALATTDWMMMRQQDQERAGGVPTLSSDKVAVLLTYRQALRDLPALAGFPHVTLPILTWGDAPL